MKYLNRQGDLNETARIKSIPLIYNWSEEAPNYCFVLPTYKRADLLKYAIQSILNQKGLEDYEILVVDDCPDRNDETERLMMSDFNLQNIAYYKHEKNLGQPGNWNKCFELSRTEWLIMLHDDDMLFPDFFCVLKQLQILYGNSVGGFFPAVQTHSFNDGVLPKRTQSPVIECKIIKERDFIQGNVIGTGALGMTLKRKKVLEMGGVNIHCGPAVDYDFYNRFARVTDIVKLYGYPLGVWRFLDNVTQKVSSVLCCVDLGDVLKMDTLEDCGLGWTKPLFKHYIKGFDEQHIRNWYREMGRDTYEPGTLRPCSLFDKIVYKAYRLYFAINRRLRRGSKRIACNQ